MASKMILYAKGVDWVVGIQLTGELGCPGMGIGLEVVLSSTTSL